MERAVSVGYILENVSLHIEPGQTWGIVGETGAGKTTLIKLIARFYDVNQGSITIDGVDVRDVLKKDVRTDDWIGAARFVHVQRHNSGKSALWN